MQTYNLGWAQYQGTGPSTASDSPTVEVDSNNGTVESDLGKGGIAGSSIAEQGWLLGIDAVSAVFGVLTAVGHLAGSVFYATAFFTAQRLFRSQFRSDRCLFRPAAKGAILLFVWTAVVGSVGLYASARESFTGSVLATLHGEDFLCQVLSASKLVVHAVLLLEREGLLVLLCATRRVNFLCRAC